MSGSIRLSKKHGINPTLTFCPRCHGESDVLVLVGRAIKYKCRTCGQMHIGMPPKRKCIQCGTCHGAAGFENLGEFDGTTDRLPAGEPCDKCKKEMDEHKRIVEAGGIYWKCSKCESEGVILGASELAGDVRRHMKIDPPAPCGVDFEGKDLCPVCKEKP